MGGLVEVKTVLADMGLAGLDPKPGGDWATWLQHFQEHYVAPLPDCPLCGSGLVRRSGKHGDFIGCSGWPGCRHTAAL